MGSYFEHVIDMIRDRISSPSHYFICADITAGKSTWKRFEEGTGWPLAIEEHFSKTNKSRVVRIPQSSVCVKLRYINPSDDGLEASMLLFFITQSPRMPKPSKPELRATLAHFGTLIKQEKSHQKLQDFAVNASMTVGTILAFENVFEVHFDNLEDSKVYN